MAATREFAPRYFGLEVFKEHKFAYPQVRIHQFDSWAARSAWIAERTLYRCGIYAEHHFVKWDEHRLIHHHREFEEEEK